MLSTKKFAVITAVVVLALWIVSPWVVGQIVESNMHSAKVDETSYFAESMAIRGQFGDLFGSVNALFSALAFIGVVVSLHFQYKEAMATRKEFETGLKVQLDEAQRSRTSAILETTQKLYEQWWSEELSTWRHHFFNSYLVALDAKLVADCTLKNVHLTLKDGDRQLSKLTGYFDYIGWLGAANLIDVDYVLGPMQQTMRKVWLATEPLVKSARLPSDEGGADSIYRLGFEWLYLRSCEENNDHASLLKRTLNAQMASNYTSLNNLQPIFETDEREFIEYLKTKGVLTDDRLLLVEKD